MKKSILSNPAFRYIFEIIVIVFSVTLSFYIQDILNEMEKIEQKNLSLSGVIDDLKKDLENFNGAITLARIRTRNIDTLLDTRFENSSSNVNTGAKRYFGFLGNDSNYNSMVSTGSLEYINDKKLFRLINRYYSSHYDIMEDMSGQDENNYNGVINYLNKKYLTFIGDAVEIETGGGLFNEVDTTYRVNFSKESLTKLKTDNEFISRINHQKWIIRANMNIFKRAIVVNKELQEMIANEINN